MINATDHPIAATEAPELTQRAVVALREVSQHLGLDAPTSSIFRLDTAVEAQLSELHLFVTGLVRKDFKPSQYLVDVAKVFGFRTPRNSSEWADVREAVRLLLVALSAECSILLPPNTPCFSREAGFEVQRKRPILHMVDKILGEHDISSKGSGQLPAIVSATNWREVGDFDVVELASLHQQMVCNGLLPNNVRGAAPIFSLLYAFEHVAQNPVKRSERHDYLMWHASGSFQSISFDEFRKDRANFIGLRVHGHKRERVETPQQVATRRSKQQERAETFRQARPESAATVQLREIAESGALDAPERYFAAMQGSATFYVRKEGWLSSLTPYPGREEIEIAEVGKTWAAVMNAWLSHRQNYFESGKDVRLSLHILADYLLLYLPWWIEQHPDSGLQYPATPRQFSRYLFVSRTVFHGDQGPAATTELPKTLLDMLAVRRPTPDARNIVVGHWHRFFQFVITAFEDNDVVAGKKMVNPVRLDFDRTKSSRRKKTNKKPFADDVFPYLVLYSQAVEAFGEYIQQLAYEQDRFSKLPYGERYGYDTSRWGYVPYIVYRERIHPVRWIPNVYTVARRTIWLNPPSTAGLYVNGRRINQSANRPASIFLPHLTVVRMLMGMIETGLRGQQIQWLDRNTWDSPSPSPASLVSLYTWNPPVSFTEMLVNTDKSNDTAWKTYIPWRVRRSFLAEQYFQSGLAEPSVNTEVDYEKRKNSRFGRIVPLFRSYQGPLPFSDSSYAGRWIDFLVGFEHFYDGCNPDADPLQLVTVAPMPDAKGSLVREEDGLEYCPLKYSTEATPHACRATYATLKDGDLEVSEIAMQLGHSNTVTTNYYQVPAEKRVKSKLEAIDQRMFGASFHVDGQGPGYITTENADSAVRRAFGSNRDLAIKQFGFVPGVALWSMNDMESADEDAIELLRQSPSSVIRWHATHVCPVGNQCPAEIIPRIGGFQRCGLCPFAVKCVDHLPAIAAKKNELKERIRMTAVRTVALSKRNVPQDSLDSLHKGMENDAKEFMGWQLATQILHDKMQGLADGADAYHVDEPEMVRRHLELVTRDESLATFFLQRIADSNAYPVLESPEVRARATRYVQIILARAGRADDAALLDLEPYSELAAFASLVKPMADAKGLSIDDIADMLTGGQRRELGSPTGPLLLGRSQ